MKKRIIIIIILVSILLDVQRVDAAETKNIGYYANIGKVYEIDKNF